MKPATTREELHKQMTAAVETARAVMDAIRDIGEVPSGELYARLMGYMSLETYQKIVKIGVDAGLISDNGHLLKWTGPVKNV